MLSEVRTSGDIHSTRVLSLDSTGRILDWMSWQDAVCLYVRGAVAWTLGDPCLTIHGGMSRLTGEQSSRSTLHPIVASRPATRGRSRSIRRRRSPTSRCSRAIACCAFTAATISTASS